VRCAAEKLRGDFLQQLAATRFQQNMGC